MNVREWFERARQENFAIGAFNVDNLEIFRAICKAGEKKKSPMMVEFSPGEVEYFGLSNIVDLVSNAREEYGIPILLNLDHARSVEDCLMAIKAGFDEVHFDGSDLSLEDNIESTKRVVEVTKGALGTESLVEGEIDKVSGSSEVHSEQVDLGVLKKSYTDSRKAAEFVQATGVDILAAVFGNIHGTYPFQPDLDFELLKKIREAVPNTFLSMHGGSGIPAEQVREAIKIGKIVKINVNTELRVAFRDALTESLGENPKEYAYWKLTPDVVTAVMAVVEAKIDVFGSAGKV